MISKIIYDGPGFVKFNIDYFIKFGGSLLFDTNHTIKFLNRLPEIAKGKRLVIFPGGGPTDKLIEEIGRNNNLHIPDICPACLRSLDQTGIILCALNKNYKPVEKLSEIRKVLSDGYIPVLLPSTLILSLDLFTRTNDITSDTLGAFFAFLTGADQYIILTNVDGIYRDYRKGEDNSKNLIQNITINELEEMGHTSVDKSLASFLKAVKMPVWVGNGFFIERLEEFIKTGDAYGTKIVESN